jgi:hypothetical protein
MVICRWRYGFDNGTFSADFSLSFSPPDPASNLP